MRPSLTDRTMGWIAYAIAWLAAALFWTLAGASSSGRPPIEALPYGALAMGSAAIMGVGVWHLTARVPLDWRSPAFAAAHAGTAIVYSVIYATSSLWLDVAAGRLAAALQGLRSSPVLIWNLLMGSWLYLIVAGLSYAIRAQRTARAQEAAAAEARLLAQQAQLAALRAQVNPHFLFNALHSIGALIGTDPNRADRALEHLGDLLRYVLGAEDEVPLGREWRFTLDYLAFEQLRLGDRLQVEADADEAAYAALVPPLVLQPLVENAVRHGIADRQEGGRVEIRARAEGEYVRVTVADDGRGGEGPWEEGVGLGSVRRRLAALHGPRARVSIARTQAGCSVSLDIPLRSAAGRESAA